jgi:hypothetical protein
VVLRFEGTWLLLVSGGDPTADKPTVVFAPPADADLVSHAMTLRVADCQAAYEALRSGGATFLTPPQPHLARQASTGRSGVAAIGVAQEFQRIWTAAEGKTSTGTPRWSFFKADRRVTCYYFYLWDQDPGPAFIKVCAWFPYPAKIWLNGHEWGQAAGRAGRDRVHCAVQRVRCMPGPGCAAGDL